MAVARALILAALGAAVVVSLAGCGIGAPTPTHSSSASASRHPRATPTASPSASALEVPAGAALIGRVRLHNAQADVRATVVAHLPTPAAQDAAAVAEIVAACPGEYDADALTALDASIMRVDYTTTAISGSPDAIVVSPRPSALSADDLGIASTGGLASTSAADVPHCRREVTITGATAGTAYLVLPGGDTPLDWRTLSFGFFPVDDGVSQYDIDDCRFALSPEVDGVLAISMAGGCLTTVTPE